MSHRRGTRGCCDGFGVILGVRRPWGRAGGRRRGEYGRAVAQQGQAAVGLAAQQPAEFGAGAAEAAQLVPVLGGVRVFVGVGVRGEEPVLARQAHHIARGLGHGEGAKQGQQQELEGGRNLGVQDRPRPGARCVGFARRGCSVWHH
jgi:hypothetical protein